ncbi:MAG: 1-deoxy-D-xylulose-5-phosphate reductoisomerase [Opitutus sp.]|nr:1-deoxy-D-xylulose-5-phosphate reductoisomerase [Opitutus sp.]MCS6246313.1 1-deoxy-D-xylulose-5-phosphate reductoisomerase [Opitutus sp.]MCS6273061.1 1-deoxy-D-xylulose-5-phosphate reductoisomerase [Opitutus sp.]MCS6277890.1 1-deoxy-D-xylulose-5-phosphate reductoisomerase [Opitutus sp.]MCS6299003.1 1-deoxy-D-xylulose-5-phosphate reductoisomerase [Opitutus sp.]
MNPPRKRVVLLGATGSIGENTLRVIAAHPDKLELVAIAARGQWEKLAAIAQQFRVPHVGLFDDTALAAARNSGAFAPGTQFHGGLAGLTDLARLPEADTVLVAVVGTTGLAPALAALAAGKDLALASKEILVLAGKFVMAAARASGAQLLPVDSEHNAVFQCLQGHASADVARITLTASGGAFRDWPAERLAHATVADALKHPNWSMGPKITVDSATLANKGLELIEAQQLFGLRPEQCHAVIHPQSIVHALVGFNDGSMIAQLCPPSMTFPIQHALLHPKRAPGVETALDFSRLLSLEFRPIDESRFPMLRIAREVMHAGGTAPAIYNAANEVAVAAFLDARLPFVGIPRVVAQTLEKLPSSEPDDLATVLAVDAEARRIAASQL